MKNSLIYLAFHGILAVILAVRIIKLRRKHRVSLGHGENSELLTATRVFGNHNEYAALTLLLLFVSEFHGAPPLFVNGIGILFTAGRIAHAVGITKKPGGPGFGRIFGMLTTFASLILCSIFLLAKSSLF